MGRRWTVVTALGLLLAAFSIPAAGAPGAPSTRATSRPASSAPTSSSTCADLAAENQALRAEIQRLRAQADKPKAPTFWLAIGFLGQFLFGLRFVVQWIVTERRKKSTIPLAFWYLSLAGTIVLLTYAIHLVDPVFIAGFSLNMIIYLRNLYFIHRRPAKPTDGK